jgi:rhodanese-related sulfurtransferase
MTATPDASLLGRLRRLLPSGKGDAPRVSVDAPRALELIRDGAVLVDVREDSEWNAGHAPQALHIRLADISTASGQLVPGKPVVVMCASGIRSRAAAEQLRAIGFAATSLNGGLAAWRAAGGPVHR